MTGYRIGNQFAAHFITFAVVEWVDVFTRQDYSKIVIKSLAHCQKEKGLEIFAWCLMSNHIHLIVRSTTGDLSGTLRDFKKFTSKAIIKAINENQTESRRNWMLWIFKSAGEKNSRNQTYQFWQQNNQPKELLSNKFIDQKIDYIHNNPI
ncbi:MAG: REP-associated tyrosine transposase, partial [Chitinophagales bacterium]